MKKIFSVQVIDVLSKVAARSKSKRVDIGSATSANTTFNTFLRMGSDIYGSSFATQLADAHVTTAHSFVMLLMSEKFKTMLDSDRIGKSLYKQIKYPTAARIAEEMKQIHNKYKTAIINRAEDVRDVDHTYAIRTKLGDGPVVFVKGVPSNESRHEVRRWYAWAHDINYFDVRECSFEHWAKNPATQIATC